MTVANTNNLIFKNKKINVNKLCLILLFILSWILFAFNYSNADYDNYKNAYDAISKGQKDDYFEFGFYVLIKIFALLQIPYQVFLGCVALVCLLIFTITIKRLTSRYSLAFLLYLIYPFAFDIVQYRNMLSFSFVLIGICFLVQNRLSVKTRAIKFLLFVILGTLFHSSAIVYSVLLFALIRKEKVFYLCVSFLFILIMYFALNNDACVAILRAVKLERYARYTYARSISTFLQYLALYVFLLALSVWKFEGKYRSVKFRLLVISSVFLPFIIMNGTSARLIRNVLVLFYCFLFGKLHIKESLNSLKQAVIVFSTFAAILYVFYSQLAFGLYYELVLRPIFEYNYLLGKL